VEDVVQQAKGFVLRYGYHPTVLAVHGANGRRYVLFEEFPADYEAKVAFLYAAGKKLSQQSKLGTLNNVFLVTEAWMVKLEQGKPFIRPSVHPKRIEVLVISRLDVLTEEQTVTTLEYVRDEKGNLIEIKESSLPHGVTAESPLLPAFVAGFTGR